MHNRAHNQQHPYRSEENIQNRPYGPPDEREKKRKTPNSNLCYVSSNSRFHLQNSLARIAFLLALHRLLIVMVVVIDIGYLRFARFIVSRAIHIFFRQPNGSLLVRIPPLPFNTHFSKSKQIKDRLDIDRLVGWCS